MQSHHYDVATHNSKYDVMPDGAPTPTYKSNFSDHGDANYVWSDKAKSLSEILRENTLPLVVKLCNENVVKDPGTPVDLQRPLVLCKEVKGKKLHARNLTSRPAARDTSRVVYEKTGPYVTFSDNFPGFFKAVDAKDHPFLTVADLARLMPGSFISTGELEGYICLRKLEDSLYQKTSLPVGLYHPTSILEETITYINKRKNEKKKAVRCLSCEDDKGKTCLFPMAATGTFYISELGSKFSKSVSVSAGCRVHKWTEYDPRTIKGLRVKMVYGKAPQQECKFTGLLEFTHLTEEHTVIGTTLTPAPRMFEMAVTTEPFFIVALNSHDHDSGTLQQKCLKYAKSEIEAYMQGIKVKKDYDIDEAEIKEKKEH